MNSFSIAAVSSEMLLEGLKNMVVGLGVVFAVLIILCVIIWAFKFLSGVGAGEDPKESAPKAPKNAPKPAVRSEGPGKMSEADVDFEDVDADTASVILGVMAEECGGNIEVTSIKKSK